MDEEQLIEIQDDSGFTMHIQYSDLKMVFHEVDQVVSECMRFFHWKSYTDNYFEPPYLTIPKELPLIQQKYNLCNEIIELAKRPDTVKKEDEISDLLNELNCYYCDKISANLGFHSTKFKKERREIVEHAVHNLPNVYLQANEKLKNDLDLVKRVVFAEPEIYLEIPEPFKHDAQIVEIMLKQSVRSIRIFGDEKDKWPVLFEVLCRDIDLLHESFEIIPPLLALTSIVPPFVEFVKNQQPESVQCKVLNQNFVERLQKLCHALKKSFSFAFDKDFVKFVENVQQFVDNKYI